MYRAKKIFGAARKIFRNSLFVTLLLGVSHTTIVYSPPAFASITQAMSHKPRLRCLPGNYLQINVLEILLFPLEQRGVTPRKIRKCFSARFDALLLHYTFFNPALKRSA